MSDLIDRNELFLSVIAQHGVVDKSVMKRLVLQVPTVDAMPVRHGHWEVIDVQEPQRYACSECNRLSWYTHNFCPNCGALMDGERKEYAAD